MALGKGFYSKIVGVTFGDVQRYIERLHIGTILTVVREPDNPYDNNAIALYDWRYCLGHLSRQVAASMAPRIDAGAIYKVTVVEITGGKDRHYGVNIFIEELGQYIFPPSHLQDLFESTYASFLDNVQKNGILMGNWQMRKLASQIALLNERYNATKELLYQRSEYESLDLMAFCLEFIGDFETTYYSRLKAKAENEVYEVRHEDNDTVLDQLNRMGIVGILQQYADCSLKKEDYEVEQSSELMDEFYPEVIEANSFFSKYNGLEQILDAIDELFMEGGAQNEIRGNAYLAELYFQTNDFKMAAIAYTKAARRARNNAVYYGYAGNSLGKAVIEIVSSKKALELEDFPQVIHGLILERRAINLDYKNARWHFYAGILLQIEAQFLAKFHRIEYAKKVLLASKDELCLAEAFLNNVNKVIYPSIQTCLHTCDQLEKQFDCM